MGRLGQFFAFPFCLFCLSVLPFAKGKRQKGKAKAKGQGPDTASGTWVVWISPIVLGPTATFRVIQIPRRVPLRVNHQPVSLPQEGLQPSSGCVSTIHHHHRDLQMSDGHPLGFFWQAEGAGGDTVGRHPPICRGYLKYKKTFLFVLLKSKMSYR